MTISECTLENLKSYRVADKSLAGATSQCILFDGENISFDPSLVIYIDSTNIPQIYVYLLYSVYCRSYFRCRTAG
jgi:hypothetical protein